PLDGQQVRVPRRFEALHYAILGPGHRGEALPEPIHRLVMRGRDVQSGGTRDPGEPASGREPDGLQREVRIVVAVAAPSVHRGGAGPVEVLNQAAAQRHVDQLGATADAEEWEPSLYRAPGQRDLERVALGVDLGHGVVRLLPVSTGGDVTTPGQQQAVDRIE